MAKVKVPEQIMIPPLKIETLELTLIGNSLLCTHAWSDKAKKMMLDKQMKKAKQGKAAKDPEQDYIDSLYWISKKPANPTMDNVKAGTFGFPAIAFKAAAVSACSHVDGMTKVLARGAFHISDDLVEIHGKPKPREDMVRIAMGTADIRYRAEFTKWRVHLSVTYNVNVISTEQIVNLFETAGFSIGVGENRPQKNGSWGRFHVARSGE